MFGFLIKLVILIMLVGGGMVYLNSKGLSPTGLVYGLKSQLNGVDPNQLVGQVSDVLDSLVSKSDSASPVVLGLKVSSESLGAVTDVLMKLPNDQLDQIRSVMCASSSGTN